jgi:PAS domain S-box-containing protein
MHDIKDRQASEAETTRGKRWPGRIFAEIIGIAIVYYLAGKLGRTVAPPPGIATVFWPPSGIAIAALVIFGNRVWPGVWLGAFLSNDWSRIDFSSFRSVLTVVGIGSAIDTGALLQSLLGAAMMKRFLTKETPFERFNDTLKFCAIALVAGIAGSTCGVVSLWMGGALPGSAFLDRWTDWWIGDTCGILVATPAILVWRHTKKPDWSRTRWTELTLLLTALIVFAATIFVWWHPTQQTRYPTDLLILPVVAWMAYRFSQRVVTLSVAIVLGIAFWGTVHGSGPYGGPTPWSNLAVLQGFIGILSVLAISVGAAISERKAATAALQTSEHWLLECQRISRVGSYVLDIKSGCWRSSETLDEILGIGPDYPRTLAGWGALVHPDDREAVLEKLRNETLKHGSCSHEYRMVRASDGKLVWVLAKGEVTLDSKGAPRSMAGTILDLTERRTMEAQLLQAQKMESVGRLAGGVAHDFNNLLTVINGYGDLVLSELPVEGEPYQQVKEIRTAGERAADLTRQLLAFSRKQVLQPKVLSLNEAVRDSENMLRRLLGEDIELVCHLDPFLMPVAADPGQLNQVILNLAINARDAMPTGGRLIIETANCTRPEQVSKPSSSVAAGESVTLIVRDNGQGMDSKTMDHVFEPFFTTKGIGRGTGLGLATVHGIVEQSGGHISVQSEVGHGSTFTIHLPTIPGTAAAAILPDRAATGTETVLVVEDEEGVRLLVAKILQNHGYRVLQASGGEEAIRVFQEHSGRIDLLITDVVMPQMRGPELAARLQVLQSGMKVLFMSGYSDPFASDGKALKAGSMYLQKPFERDALARAVRDALRRADSAS